MIKNRKKNIRTKVGVLVKTTPIPFEDHYKILFVPKYRVLQRSFLKKNHVIGIPHFEKYCGTRCNVKEIILDNREWFNNKLPTGEFALIRLKDQMIDHPKAFTEYWGAYCSGGCYGYTGKAQVWMVVDKDDKSNKGYIVRYLNDPDKYDTFINDIIDRSQVGLAGIMELIVKRVLRPNMNKADHDLAFDLMRV